VTGSRFPWQHVRGHLLLVATALFGVGWASQSYLQANADVAQSQERLTACRKLAREIQENRDQPTFASMQIAHVGELTHRIATARQQAGIEEQSIDLVDPRNPERLKDSGYLLRPVAIALRGLTLKQVAQFSLGLSEPATGLWVSQLRLVPHRRDADPTLAELWNAEIVLTQLVFSPIVRTPSRSPLTSSIP